MSQWSSRELKLPSALNVPQMHISNGNSRPYVTPVLTVITPLASPQLSPMPTATNGQTNQP
ncbi:hypothetical protein BC826DRAFT_1020169 [Russula brevipes]|nr:hypothetical protein BC826DRAFT_1020169 [Russula brevipes]